jgi:saccharopine dehydrogenase-like NADP-dependent oxidoreductase
MPGDKFSMRILVVGCGNIGSVAAKDLAKSLGSADIVVADKNEERAKKVAENIGTDNVSHVRLDIEDHQELLSTLKDSTLVLGFLPGGFGYRLVEACIDARRDIVDVSFMGENLLKLTHEAAEAGVTIVPDCGLAPGISNLLVGHAAEGLDQVTAVHIFVGGLPEKPLPPLGYVVTWSPESLIDEYTRKARIITKGRETEVEALSGLETIEFPSFGKVEAFYTDGLRTLLHTIHVTDEMWEKTLRYPGHAEKIKVLKDLGFFDKTQVDVEGASISPRKLTATLLEQKLHKPSVKDVVALKVEVSGIKNQEQTTYLYHLLDFYDEKQKITAMARTTAYTASIVAQLILKKTIKNKGLVPVEKIGADPEHFKKIIGELQKRLVKVTEKIRRD